MTAPNAELDLDALEKLDREATPGPWYADIAISGDGSVVMSDETCMRVSHLPETPRVHNHAEDAALIAAMRNAIPSLLQAARERDRLAKQVRAFERDLDHSDAVCMANAKADMLKLEVAALQNSLAAANAHADELQRQVVAADAENRAVHANYAARLAQVAQLEEQLRRSATVCPKDGCMLWRGHTEAHATRTDLEAALAGVPAPRAMTEAEAEAVTPKPGGDVSGIP